MARHGETELRSSVRFWGQTDVKLSALGIKQAERLRDLLAADNIDIIYSSNLQRASATAEIIASKHNNTEIIICPEQTALIVAHSGSLRMLICHLLGIGTQNWHRLHLDFASLSAVETHSGGAVLMSLNNTSHLGGIN